MNFYLVYLLNPFLKNEKLVIISRATEKLFAIINIILEGEFLETKIIIKSTNLEKKSKLRNLLKKKSG